MVLDTVLLATSSSINIVSLANVAGDVLVVWYDFDRRRSAAAILYANGRVVSLSRLAETFIARHPQVQRLGGDQRARMPCYPSP